MNDTCNHEKVYEESMMMSLPPKQRWICKKCGAIGVTIIGIPKKNDGMTYESLKKRLERATSKS